MILKVAKEKRGITLIALVITIVILIILATVAINAVFGENGLIKKAEEAKNTWKNGQENDMATIQDLEKQIDAIQAVDIETVTDSNHETLKAKDAYGNIIIVPKGFKIVTSEGTTVPEGIVIEDINENQFVWIPVGKVYKNAEKTESSTIQLGRYTFDANDGTPKAVQLAYTPENPTNYMNEVKIKNPNAEYIEVDESREGIVDNSNRKNNINATAKDLAGFIQSVKENGGYYLARYEASYKSGSSVADWKPLSKKSTDKNEDDMHYEYGTLWNFVTQLQASKICQNMYKNDDSVGVESDLVNSYAWDTAVVFIQEMSETNSNYANKTDGNGTLKNTGETGDKACNIYDMAANLREFTTEYCLYESTTTTYPCTGVGGYYSSLESNNTTVEKAGRLSTDHYVQYGFRVLLYVDI